MQERLTSAHRAVEEAGTEADAKPEKQLEWCYVVDPQRCTYAQPSAEFPGAGWVPCGGDARCSQQPQPAGCPTACPCE